MLLFVVVLLKRTIYNKETKKEAKNERRENERNENGKGAHGRFCTRPELLAGRPSLPILTRVLNTNVSRGECI